MSTTISHNPVYSRERVELRSVRIPNYVYASVFSSLCIAVGLIWDISWHMSVGRDGLLSPPHLVMYLGAVVAGVFSGVRVLKTSFWGSAAEKGGSIKFWGIFHGSLGAMFCIWGAFAMLTSAPFDDWWHNTYGLDVKILSPPHLVLGLGMIMIQFGAIVSVLATQNNFNLTENPGLMIRLRWLFGLSAGFLLVMAYIMVSEFFFNNKLHGATPYKVAAMVFPLLIVAISFASPYKWGGTMMALAYSLLMAAMVWILPMFSAEPRLSPIYNHITQYQPFHFPLLLLFPSLIVDLLVMKWKTSNRWILAIGLAFGFLAVFVPFQWVFADFMHTEAARGWFFGRFSWPYSSNPDWEYRFAFHPGSVDTGWNLVKGLAIALLFGIFSSRIGLAFGNWMSQVKR
jgi:hypothetical protein